MKTILILISIVIFSFNTLDTSVYCKSSSGSKYNSAVFVLDPLTACDGVRVNGTTCLSLSTDAGAWSQHKEICQDQTGGELAVISGKSADQSCTTTTIYSSSIIP